MNQILQIPIEWIRADKYCELTGETMPAIKNRKSRGEWIEGVHVQKRAGKLWVNLVEHGKWVRQGLQTSHEA